MIYLITADICFIAAMAMLLYQIWQLEEKVDQLNARLMSIEQRRTVSAPPELSAPHVNMPQFL